MATLKRNWLKSTYGRSNYWFYGSSSKSMDFGNKYLTKGLKPRKSVNVRDPSEKYNMDNWAWGRITWAKKTTTKKRK